MVSEEYPLELACALVPSGEPGATSVEQLTAEGYKTLATPATRDMEETSLIATEAADEDRCDQTQDRT